jgi:hypothetical protein
MKLLIVTAIKECRKEVARLFNENGIGIYSVTNMHGVRSDADNRMVNNWFGGEWEERYESVMLFSFTEDAAAERTLSSISSYNHSQNSPFPIKAFILPVEKGG